MVDSPRTILSFLVILVLATNLAPSGDSKAFNNLKDPEKTLNLFVEAKTETTEPFLAIEDDAAGPVDQYKPPQTGLTSGAASQVSYHTNGAPVVINVPLAGGLPKTYHLNLSKEIQATFYWTATHFSVPFAEGQDNGRLKFDLYVGNTRVGGTNHLYFIPLGSAGTVGAWARVTANFRPEVASLPAGQPLTLKITRAEGMADFVLGTGGNHQSTYKISYFDSDPLASALYLEAGVLTASPPEEPADDQASLAYALAGLPLLALAAVARTRRAPPLAIVALLLASTMLGGCLGGADDTTTQSQTPVGTGPSKVETGYQDDAALQEKGQGALRGIVRDGEKVGVPLAGAHVSVLGTNRFADTGNDGSYAFENMTPKRYDVRIDLPGYVSSEHSVEVVVGRVAYLNVTLFKPQEGQRDPSNNAKPHLHDYWEGQKAIVWQDFTYTPGTILGAPGTPWVCDATSSCISRVPINVSRPVLPGTTRIEIWINWTKSSTTVPEMSLFVYPAAVRNCCQRYNLRGPGDPYNVAFFPGESDPGHQKFTNWQFELWTPSTYFYNPAGPGVFLTGDINVKMILHKGVVPFEPKHRDFWEGKGELELFNAQSTVVTCNTCDFPRDATGVRWPLTGAMFVPQGTKEIIGQVRWSGSTGTDIPWTLAAKPADVPNANWAQGLIRFQDVTRSATSADIRLPVDAAQADQFYQSVSNWIFYMEDQKAPVAGPFTTNVFVSMTFTFSLTAIKDPSYKDT